MQLYLRKSRPIFLLAYISLMALIMQACLQQNETLEPAKPEAYINFSKGDWRQYTVDSIVYDDFTNTIDTFKYKIRIVIDSVWQPNPNRIVHLAYAYRVLPNNGLAAFKTIQYELNPLNLLTTDNNQTLVSLAFPIIRNKTWWGNANSAQTEARQFRYTLVQETVRINNKFYFDVARVRQLDEQNFIFRNFAEELYGPKIGLLRQELIDIETQNNRRSGYHYIAQIDTFAIKGIKF